VSSAGPRAEALADAAPAHGRGLSRPAIDREALWRWRAAHAGIVREEALEYVRRLASVVGVPAGAVVLDFGGGVGFVSEALSPLAGVVWWWDPSPAMRAVAAPRLAKLPNARILPGEALAGEPAAEPRFDLILVNSVVQYMPPDELRAWLGAWRDLLRPAGQIVLSDLVAPGHGLVGDALDQVWLGVRGGFLARALLAGLVELGPIRAATRRHGFTRLAPEDLRGHARAAGLETRFLPGSLTHRRRRFAAVLSVPGDTRASRD
jgi:SAM-dependent methyltransferase